MNIDTMRRTLYEQTWACWSNILHHFQRQSRWLKWCSEWVGGWKEPWNQRCWIGWGLWGVAPQAYSDHCGIWIIGLPATWAARNVDENVLGSVSWLENLLEVDQRCQQKPIEQPNQIMIADFQVTCNELSVSRLQLTLFASCLLGFFYA